MKKSILTIAITMISTLSMLSQSWTQVGSGLSSTVNGLYTDASANRLYATGAFTGKVAYLSGSTWSVVPSYTGTTGNSILSYSSTIIPMGTIIVCADKIYSYETGAWSARTTGNALSKYTASCVDSLTDYLYVAGLPIGASSYKIFKYDLADLYVVSGTLTPVATYTSPNFPTSTGKINDLKILNNVLYIGLENSGAALMQLDLSTSSLTTVGTPTIAVNVKCLSVNSNQLYVTGSFNSFNNPTPSNNLTSYNGTAFQSYGSLMNSATLGQNQMYNGKLYVAGSTNTLVKVVTGTNTASPIVSIYPMATTGSINTMAVYNGDLYAGGTFTVSTGGSSHFDNIAKYNSSVTTTLNNMQQSNNVNIYPNPFTNNLTIDVENSYILDVFDYTGRKIRTINCNGKTEITLEKSGIYFIEVNNENIHFIKKVIKE